MTTTPTLAIARGVARDHTRTVTLWGAALAAVTTLYVAIYPAIGGADLATVVESLPQEMIEAFGYDEIGTAAGYITSTVYSLIGPALLWVFAIGTGARMIAGREEDGSLELELAAPVDRRSIYLERMVTLWLSVLALVGVVFAVTSVIVVALDLDVEIGNVLAGSVGLFLLVIGLGTLSFAVGAATGRRVAALGVASGLAVMAFMFDAIGPSIDAGWMTAISPFSWYTEARALFEGWDPVSLGMLAIIPMAVAWAGMIFFERRDVMV